MPRQVCERGQRKPAEQERKARLLQLALARLGKQRPEKLRLRLLRQRLRRMAARDLVRIADERLRLLRPSQHRYRRIRTERRF